MSSSANKKALDLLISSVEKCAASDSEWELLRSTLHSNAHWNETADSLLSLLKSSQSLDVCPLYILEDLISHSSPEQLRECCSRWVEYLSGQMQKAGDLVSVKNVCRCYSSLLDRCHSMQKGMSDFTSRHLPGIMSSLLWYTAADHCLQCAVIPLVTKCLVYYPKPCVQFKGQLLKWVNSGLFSPSQQLSQECSRLLVLVCGPSVLESLSRELQSAISCLYGQDTQVCSRTCVVDIPSIPSEEPARSALLLRLVCVLSRTLCYALLFPTTSTSVPVPLDKLMGMILGGLELQQQQVTGLSYDKLLLHSLIPTVHSSLWALLTTLIHTCHSHLLSFTTVIESCIVRELTSDMESEFLLLSVHRCLSAWLSVQQDADSYFLTFTISSLLKMAESSSVPQCVQLSSLATLATMVRAVGAYFPVQVCSAIQKLALKGISLTTPPLLAACKLDLLLACVSSSNNHLRPSVGGALSIFSMGMQHQSAKVREVCQSACVQCELIRHPMAPPVLTPPSRVTQEHSVLSDAFHLSNYAASSQPSSAIPPPTSTPPLLTLNEQREKEPCSLKPEGQALNESTPEPENVQPTSTCTAPEPMNFEPPLPETTPGPLYVESTTPETILIPDDIPMDTSSSRDPPTANSDVIASTSQVELPVDVDNTEVDIVKVCSVSPTSDDSIEEDLKLFKAVPPDLN